MDKYRVAGEIVSVIHVLWGIATSLSGLCALIGLFLGTVFSCNPSPIMPGFPGFMIRLAVCCGAFYFTQVLVARLAQKIYGKCPMLLLEQSLLMRNHSLYDTAIRSPFCERLARYGIRLSPDATVFTATISLALAINLLLFAPIVYALFCWL